MSAENAKNQLIEGPSHVAIIMDGNGRWAQQRGLRRLEGHKKGAEAVQRVLQAMQDTTLSFLTLYAFSTENWNRPRQEIEGLMHLLDTFLTKYSEEVIKQEVRFRVIGNYKAFKKKLVKKIDRMIESTEHFTGKSIILALNYSSRAEVIDAVKRYVEATQSGDQKIENLDWEVFSQFLDTARIPDPDLIIRTSGEHRLSNFLMLQGAYAEIYVTPTYWPDFNDTSFFEAIDAYNARERRFGKTGEQIKQELVHA